MSPLNCILRKNNIRVTFAQIENLGPSSVMLIYDVCRCISTCTVIDACHVHITRFLETPPQPCSLRFIDKLVLLPPHARRRGSCLTRLHLSLNTVNHAIGRWYWFPTCSVLYWQNNLYNCWIADKLIAIAPCTYRRHVRFVFAGLSLLASQVTGTCSHNVNHVVKIERCNQTLNCLISARFLK